MNYLPMMAEDEIKHVCSVIPLQESVGYFKRYPKEFAKVMPGFRATSLRDQEQVSAVLFRSRHQRFISSFIEKHISRWLDEIQREISRITENGESKESAWLQTFPYSLFVDDIRIFFKLTGEEMSEADIAILGQSIRRIRDLDIERNKLVDSLSELEFEQARLKGDVIRIQAELDTSRKKLIERSGEIKTLKRTNADLEKLVAILSAQEREVERFKEKVQERDETIHQLRTELSAALEEQQQLATRVREEREKQKVGKFLEQAAPSKPRCPKDIDEFRDYIGYNLEDLGVETSADYYPLLKDYLSEILFTGKPILVSRNSGLSIIKCVSNALVSSANVATLLFSPDVSVDKIDKFLSLKNRVLCLDNFIGNFNETILTTICEKHKDKIVFMTVAYDKTLQYVPEAFLRYCHYLNVNRIEAFSRERDLTEDPSSIEETEASNSVVTPDVVWAPLLKDILEEVGACKELAVYRSSWVPDEGALIRLLAFDILPYCVDVLNIAPFAVSERLSKYAGDKGRCSYKELLRRWFS